MDPATIDKFEYRFNPGQPNYDVILNGYGIISSFNDVRIINSPGASVPTQNTIEYRVIVNDPTVPTKSTTITGAGDVMNLAPATNIIISARSYYLTDNKIDQLTNILINGKDPGNGQTPDKLDWVSYLKKYRDNLEIIKYTIRFDTSTFLVERTGGIVAGVQFGESLPSGRYYSHQIAKLLQ